MKIHIYVSDILYVKGGSAPTRLPPPPQTSCRGPCGGPRTLWIVPPRPGGSREVLVDVSEPGIQVFTFIQ